MRNSKKVEKGFTRSLGEKFAWSVFILFNSNKWASFGVMSYISVYRIADESLIIIVMSFALLLTTKWCTCHEYFRVYRIPSFKPGKHLKKTSVFIQSMKCSFNILSFEIEWPLINTHSLIEILPIPLKSYGKHDIYGKDMWFGDVWISLSNRRRQTCSIDMTKAIHLQLKI